MRPWEIWKKESFPLVTVLASVLIAGTAIGVAGCEPVPDPNDPAQAGNMQPEVLRTNLRLASDVINERVRFREIEEKKGQEMLAEYADKLVASVELKEIPQREAWQYADVFRTARRWKEAKYCYELALMKPLNSDRRINDTLRYGQCLAHLGDVAGAIEQAKKTFDADPDERAPILLSVMLEIVPPSKGKGYDSDLAGLLLRAAELHATTKVNGRTTEGLAFLISMNHHIEQACKTAAALFRADGEPAAAQAAMDRLPGLIGLAKENRKSLRASRVDSGA